MAASDIPLARQALAALRRGRTPDRLQSEALDRVDRLSDAARPLSAYAPRTQRRYLAAASVGANAHIANRIEYEKNKARKSRGGGGVSGEPVSLRGAIRDAAERNASALDEDPGSRGGGDNLGQFDEDQIDELINLVGQDGALAILETQWDSMQAYKRGDSATGKDRWNDRPDIVERYRKGLGHDEYTVPYFWYRARR
jgi:hypothetical protein